MHNLKLKNVWLVAKREYLERVRTKAFIFLTLLTPAMIYAWGVLPSMMIMSKTGGTKRIVIVSSDPGLGDAISRRLLEKPESAKNKSNDASGPEVRYSISTSTALTEENRAELQRQIDQQQIDGFLWLDDKSMREHNITYTAGSTSDFVEIARLEGAVSRTLIQEHLKARGIPEAEVRGALKRYEIEAVQWSKGAIKKSNDFDQFLSIFLLGFAMYMTVMIYGISVMRSVVQEKTSRIMEVLMSTLTATELMAGKIIGVGAVGLTQIVIWVSAGALLAAPAAFSFGKFLRDANWTLTTGISFGIFFICGYFLYSSMCAALGAMVSSEQEAHQLQMFVLLPLIVSFFMMFKAMRVPDDPMIVVLSMIPFFAPILMYTRIVVQTPPAWQIVTCIGTLIVTICLVLVLCARIYRVGILIYGKRVTIPEILKVIRYA